MIVRTRGAGPDRELQPGDGSAVPPMTAHRLAGKNGGRRCFVIVQGVGTYDNVPLNA